MREEARLEAATILRLLRNVPPGEPDNFALNTRDQIIAQFDRLGYQIFLATIALAGVSLIIGASASPSDDHQRHRAHARDRRALWRLRQAGRYSGSSSSRRPPLGRRGIVGVGLASALGLLASFLAPTFPGGAPTWACWRADDVGGRGIVAGYWPAGARRCWIRSRPCATNDRRSSATDPARSV